MDRLLNYIFLLILIYIFALFAPAAVQGTIIVGIVVSFVFSALAFLLKWLSLDGAGAATVVGAITFGFGGWPTILALLFFFISSSVISLNSLNDDEGSRRRNGMQIWANGFWLVFWLILGLLTNQFVCWMAALAAIATATADTWATELGSRRFNTKTYLLTPFKPVPPGSQGGVSWAGLAASAAGSGIIGLITWSGFSIYITWFFFILLSGLAGSLFDSYLGAAWQGKTYHMRISQIKWKKEITIENNMVNWLATGFGSLLTLILNLVFYEMV